MVAKDILKEKEIQFIIFLLCSLAENWNKSPMQVYQVLSVTGILDEYIIPCYDVLHTLGKEYLVEDITEFVSERMNQELSRVFVNIDEMKSEEEEREQISQKYGSKLSERLEDLQKAVEWGKEQMRLIQNRKILAEIQEMFKDDKGWPDEESMIADMAAFRREREAKESN